MRITNSSIMRNYLGNLHSSINNLSKSNERLSSMRKYSKSSENTTEASKAFTVRDQLYKNEQYLSNIEYSIDEFSAAETSLLTINSLLQTVQERSIRANTGTIDETGRSVIAKEIENIKGQVLQSINIKFGIRYLFGNSNNEGPPFSVDDEGMLAYNGIRVADMVSDSSTGKLMYKNPAYDPTDAASKQYIEVPKNKDVYMDVGLGIKVVGNEVMPSSAIKISSSGIEAIGFGENNLYDLLTDIENSLRTGEMTDIDKKLEALADHKDNILIHVTDLGSRTSYLEKSKERIENEVFNLKVKQRGLEAVDLEYETINNKSLEMAWMINLQLGSQILPASIFDFLR
ncbi:MAG: hypothetical protein GX257_00930 [Clostridiales bacterium]|jgi:flagellar hook-associated protein 3 FlgL|nr:hypothetical protein [Clostridiales bacterium]